MRSYQIHLCLELRRVLFLSQGKAEKSRISRIDKLARKKSFKSRDKKGMKLNAKLIDGKNSELMKVKIKYFENHFIPNF